MINAFLTRLYVTGLVLCGRAKTALKEERGDTNIISIIIILAIVVALAVVFRTAIFDLFNTIWEKIVGVTSTAVN